MRNNFLLFWDLQTISNVYQTGSRILIGSCEISSYEQDLRGMLRVFELRLWMNDGLQPSSSQSIVPSSSSSALFMIWSKTCCFCLGSSFVISKTISCNSVISERKKQRYCTAVRSLWCCHIPNFKEATFQTHDEEEFWSGFCFERKCNNFTL